MKTNLRARFQGILPENHSTPPELGAARRRWAAPERSPWVATAVLAGSLLRWSPASATVLMGGVPAEAANHHSFVRDATGATVALDYTYATDISGAYNGTFDVLMQQCFGGGFLNDIATINQPHAFTSASAWNEPSYFLVNRPLIGNDSVRDYTDAWRGDVNYQTARAIYNATLGANPGTKDPFAPPGVTRGIINTTTYVEHPQYESPDPGPLPGPNDLRPIFTPGAGGNNYAIIVSWDTPRAGNANDLLREQVDVARIYDTLRTTYAVPFNNIVVLFNGDARNTAIGAINGIAGDAHPNGENLGAVTIDGPNTRANWLSALAGNMFVNGNNQLGIQYGAGDRLFIYNTGHGGECKLVPMPNQPGLWIVPYQNGFSVQPQLDDVGSIVDADGTDLLQISTRSLVTDPAIHLTVNGADLGSMANLLVTSPGQLVYDLAGLVTDPTFTYQVRVDPALFAATPSTFDVGLVDPLSPGYVPNPHLIAAIDVSGGLQELLTVYVPEPSAAAMALAALLVGGASIRRI